MEATNMPDNESDLRSRVVNLEHTAAANVQRLTSIESRLVKYDIDDARKDEQMKTIQSQITSLDKKFDEKTNGIASSLKTINMYIIGGIIAGIIGFMLKGGFHIPG
ncbi:hypothetical protein [Ochrobactrum sp. MC-1LL]|uniref:Uncharacterized protein n=2 Tax=Brucella intermedia TaxID=94625 RepID=M5JU71_9HYPH|nr:hypothetical protein [Ochrobactrum sp. MC-1LL]ELT46816.1 hypothetical protein D584_22556 [Brucella intermedia M86]NKE77525.1 hypothetical protein [Ochrobactrum sp. MC-1LL]